MFKTSLTAATCVPIVCE